MHGEQRYISQQHDLLRRAIQMPHPGWRYSLDTRRDDTIRRKLIRASANGFGHFPASHRPFPSDTYPLHSTIHAWLHALQIGYSCMTLHSGPIYP